MIYLGKAVLKKIKRLFRRNVTSEMYDFNKSNPLGGNGERVDIYAKEISDIDFDKLDMYQKSHYKRYQFASEIINRGDVCGDFACGTGYGSIMISEKAREVVAIDLDTHVINSIKERYKNIRNVTFHNDNLLDLDYSNFFDAIISFETIEHFAEKDIINLISKFAKAIKKNGRFIFSTPYMQVKSENAVKYGFHLTFDINEDKIGVWLEKTGFRLEKISFQNYDTHNIQNDLQKKDFLICIASKI